MISTGAYSAVLALAIPAFAAAQGGYIGVFENPQGSDCDLQDTFPAVRQFYVVHHAAASGARGSRFRVVQGGGALLIFLTETPAFTLFEGSAEPGLTVCYNACYTSPVLVTTLIYFGQGLSLPCSYISVEAHPEALSGRVEKLDCDGAVLSISGFTSPLNGGVSCPCFVSPLSQDKNAEPSTKAPRKPGSFPLCQPVPTEASTWGRIKALYEDPSR